MVAKSIPFSMPTVSGKELQYLKEVIQNPKASGDNLFISRCQNWIENHTKCQSALLTTSCTHALEMMALLLNIQPGDEVIMPSYGFSSTANAFVLRGAKIVFIDIRQDTLNLDEGLIEAAINARTKAIVPVHYAGVACEMDSIMHVANKHGLAVLEDAAQAMMATYKGRALGSIGDLGAFSFHVSKNYQCGEGGALLINNPAFIQKAEVIREKGTNRSQFFRGEIDKYTWVDAGSSYILSDLNSAVLFAQIQQAGKINEARLINWHRYFSNLESLEQSGILERPHIPEYAQHNAHIFYVKLENQCVRDGLISFLREHGVCAVFHYVPLHSSPAGRKYGVFHGEDKFTTEESSRLLRLPLFHGINAMQVDTICDLVARFFREGV